MLKYVMGTNSQDGSLERQKVRQMQFQKNYNHDTVQVYFQMHGNPSEDL